jgi:hypothetical protein
MSLYGALSEDEFAEQTRWCSEATMLRNQYVVIEVSDRDVRLRQTLPRFEFLVSKSEFEPGIVAGIAIGDTFSGIDRGSVSPFDLVLEKKAPYEPNLETKSEEPAEQANFRFVPGFCAGTAREAESYLQNATEGEFAVISGETQRTANGWLVPIKLISELYSRS